MTEKIGGPSVFPPQPASVTTEGTYGGLSWNDSTGLDRYRRGLYTFTKRTAPFAMLSTFDAPSGEACVARREVTQHAAAGASRCSTTRCLSKSRRAGARRRVAVRTGTPEEIARTLFRRCLTRPPDRDELAALVAFQRKELERFERDPKAAQALVKAGRPAAARAGRLAAWTAVARGLLNLDETITKE